MATLEEEGIPVSESCRILQLPRSSYYRRQQNVALAPVTPESVDAEEAPFFEIIRQIAGAHPFWGYRRISAYLRTKCAIRANRKRVRRILRKLGLSVAVKTHAAKRAVTRSKPRPTRMNEWWGTDMTKFYVDHVGWVYLVVVLDWYTKRVLGFALGLRPSTDLWLTALRQAVEVGCPLGSRAYEIHLMSDNGSQPTSKRYEKELETLGIIHVTTSYNNPKGNADTERFMKTFKEEIVWPNEYESFSEATAAVERFIHFYNHDYPHSAIGQRGPIDFEQSLSQISVAA